MRNHILNLYLKYSEKRRNENKIGNTFPYTIHWRERSGKFGLSVIFLKKNLFQDGNIIQHASLMT